MNLVRWSSGAMYCWPLQDTTGQAPLANWPAATDFNGPTHGLSTFVFLFRRALLGYSTKNMNIALTLAGSEGNQATQQLDQ